jgi:hypothetical protein
VVGDASTHGAALFEALARDEAAGRRWPNLTEAGRGTWQRFQGPLGSGDLLRLLAEDSAVLHPVLFAAGGIGVSHGGPDDPPVDSSLTEVPSEVDDWLRGGGADAPDDEQGSGR